MKLNVYAFTYVCKKISFSADIVLCHERCRGESEREAVITAASGRYEGLNGSFWKKFTGKNDSGVINKRQCTHMCGESMIYEHFPCTYKTTWLNINVQA